MAIFLPRNWRQQPTHPVELDYSHPLAQGCVFASLGGQQYDAAMGRPMSWGGTAIYRSAQLGPGPSFTGANAQIFPRDALMEPSDAITMIAHAQRTGTSGLGRILHKHNASIGFWLSSYFLLQGVDNPNQTNALITISGTARETGNYNSSAAELERPFSQVATWASGGPIRQYVNGILRTTGTSYTGTISYDSSSLYLGNSASLSSGYAFAGVVNGALVYNRALSAAEAAELSLYTGNPWQLFRPRTARIYSFPSAGGGSIESGAGSSAGVATASAVGASTAAAAGTSDGVATAAGVGASTAEAVGTAAGTATASAVGDVAGGVQSGAGTSAGTSTASGVGASTAASVGTAAGTSTAAAVGSSSGGVQEGVGTAAGQATAAGVGASTAEAVGTAAGSSTASAVGTDAASQIEAASLAGLRVHAAREAQFFFSKRRPARRTSRSNWPVSRAA